MKPLLNVHVLSAELPTERWATVMLFHGEVMGGRFDGTPVRFTVDHRMAHDLVEAIANEDRVMVMLERWQITGMPGVDHAE